jgi:ABC-type branched-subunit amino acid transport system substrate-binding protein
MVGAYKPCAAFIKQARATGLNAVFVNISFVGSNALAKELGKDGEGVVVTQVVPFPEDTSVPLVAQYQKALKADNGDAEFGFVSLEGYMVGRLVVQALDKLGESVTRNGLLATIKEAGEFDLGGVTLTYGPNDSQGMDQVFLTVIQSDGSIEPVDRLTKT